VNREDYLEMARAELDTRAAAPVEELAANVRALIFVMHALDLNLDRLAKAVDLWREDIP
jgi:hypothetical protein